MGRPPPTSERHNINAALTAHHLMERVWATDVKPMDKLERHQLTGHVVRDSSHFFEWAFGELPRASSGCRT